MYAKRMLIGLLLALAAGGVFAQDAKDAPKMTPEQEAMMKAWEAAGKVGPEHERLKAFEGTWDAATSMWMDPSAPPEVGKGSNVTKPEFGGRFQRMEYSGMWQGQPFTGIAFTGYDNVRRKYVGTWMDSMSTAAFVSYGDYDDASKTYTFWAEMPDPVAPATMIKVRETVKVDSPDQHTMTWYETRGDGKEAKTMQIVYTRRK